MLVLAVCVMILGWSIGNVRRAQRLLDEARGHQAEARGHVEQARQIRATLVKKVDSGIASAILTEKEAGMNLGAVLLDRWLVAQGKHRCDFAADLGMSKSSLSQYLLGHRRPIGDTTVRFERATAGAVPMQAWRVDGDDHDDDMFRAVRTLSRASRAFWGQVN